MIQAATNQKEHGPDAWWLFSLAYAGIVSICLSNIYNLAGNYMCYPLMGVHVFLAAFGVFLIMESLRGN